MSSKTFLAMDMGAGTLRAAEFELADRHSFWTDANVRLQEKIRRYGADITRLRLVVARLSLQGRPRAG